MSLVSETFALFALVLVIAYFCIPGKYQWCCLLAFSCLFYLSGGLRYGLYILVTAVSAYFCAIAIGDMHKKTKAYLKENKAVLSKEERSDYKKRRNQRCKALMVAALLLNLGILCVFKYSDFVLDQLTGLFPGAGLPDSLNLVIPLGISFYTFQTVGYVVDVYWQKVEPQRNFGKLLLFVSFFPQITQGPISEYNQLAPQLYETHTFQYRNFSLGLQRMAWGFFKKMVIADRAAPLVRTAFSEYASMSGNNVLLGAFLYSLQIYADFSGYMDIVCGLCEILGIRLTENFERPYFSKSVAEYWRRWHMSLGTWFKTYIYYPVAVSGFAKKCSSLGTKAFGRTFGKTVGASVALIVVWFSTGLWHGASWGYIAWGGLNGLAIILALWMEPVFEKMKAACRINERSFVWRAFATARTFFLVTLIKVFPEVGGFRAGVEYWKHCFMNWSISLDASLYYPITSRKDLLILGCGAVLIFLTSLMQRKGSIRQQIAAWPVAVRYAIFIAMFFAIILLGIPTQNAGGGFLYAQF